MAASGAIGAGAVATLPAFSASEARVRKMADANVLLFALPVRSSALLPLLRPASHAYEQRDWRWLHLLQAAALVPSRRVDTLRGTVRQALALLVSPALRQRLEVALRPLLDALDAFPGGDGTADVTPERLVLGLQLKDRIAAFLREWIADPVEGVVLRKECVVAGLRLDDVVATPVGAGYLRAYRGEDDFCTVVYPWGHSFIHRSQVEKAELALARQLRKRKANEFVPLEHQHLFEQVESLAENLPPESKEEVDDQSDAVVVSGVNVEEYKALLASLEEEHADAEVLEQDLSFLRRVQALASKTRELYASKRPRLDDDDTDEQQQGETGEEEEEEEDNDEGMEEEVERKQPSGQTDVKQQQQEEQQQQEKEVSIRDPL